jgi:hypothetical protein
MHLTNSCISLIMVAQTARQVIDQWADLWAKRPLKGAGDLSVSQKGLSISELGIKAPTLIWDKKFLHTLETRYKHFLDTPMPMEVIPTKPSDTPSFSDIRNDVATRQFAIQGFDAPVEKEEPQTNSYHSNLLQPVVKLVGMAIAYVGAKIPDAEDYDSKEIERLLGFRPHLDSQLSHSSTGGSGKAHATIPDHTIHVATIPYHSIHASQENQLSVVCIEDKNTKIGESKWEALNNQVNKGHSNGQSDVERIWRQVSQCHPINNTTDISVSVSVVLYTNAFRQVNCQLSTTNCMFGKLTTIYCTWYFWKSGDNLYISELDRFKDRKQKEVYYLHMKKTFLLIIAAIHQKYPQMFGTFVWDDLVPPAAEPAALLTAMTSGIVSLRNVAGSWTWGSFLAFATWVCGSGYMG